MRWYWYAFFLAAFLLPLRAEDWTTADGKVYHNVTVLGAEDDGVHMTYDGGVGKIPYYELPVDIQKRFGQDVDSLAAKKRAIDAAVQDAVNSAATSQIVAPQNPLLSVPAVVSPASPAGQPAGGNPAAPGVAPSGAMVPGTTTTVSPGASVPGAASLPGAAAPSGVTTTNPAGTFPNAANPAGPGGPNRPAGAAAGPGASPNSTPNTAPGAPKNTAANGSHPAGPGAAPGANGAQEVPSLDEPLSRTPEPSGLNSAGGKPLQLTVANYSYNDSLDVSYLDCPAIDVTPVPAPRTPPPAGQGSSLTLRMVTDGRTPQAPDRVELTFLCVGGDGGDLSTRPITFNTDPAPVAVDDSNRKDSGTLPSGGQSVQYTSFYLPIAQVRQICSGKPVTFTVGDNNYRIDEHGAAVLHGYVADIDTLEPATPSIIHTFYKLLARIPSIFTIISTICEYLILGSFALIVTASVLAFILGVTRFIKM